MSENTFKEMSDSFKDYKTNNFEDNELQTQLYAEIYYTSNNQDDLNTTDIPRTIQFDSICNELNIVPEGLSKSQSKHSRSKDVIGQSTHNDTLNVQKSINVHMSVEIPTNRNKSDQEANPIDVESNNTMNESYSAMKENSGKKRKSPNTKKHKKNLKKTLTNMVSLNNLRNETTYSKYDVRQKCEKLQMLSITQNDKIQEISDDSDSEVSIVEIPVSPKPKPPLIDLQDSDEEDVRLADKGNLHEKACRKVKNAGVTLTNANLENKETSSSEANKFLKNKNSSKSPRNKNTVNVGETTQTTTDTQEIREDVILNCSPVKKVASNMSEIQKLAQMIDESERDILVENVKHKKKMLQKIKKYGETNENLLHMNIYDTHMNPSKGKLPTKKIQHQDANINDREYNIGHVQNFIENMLIPFRDQHEAVELKRKSSNQSDDNVKYKRQCTQQNDQNVTPQDNNDKKIRDEDKYFYDTTPSLELRDYCNSIQDSDISEAQRSMPKDPEMWKILDVDLMPCPTVRSRKFLFNVRCSGCHQKGHQRIDCKASLDNGIPICYMCGEKGHVESRCSLKMCLTCGKQQNTFRKTCECCRVLYCTMCDSVGHKADTCPDLWRRYHQTTNMSDVPQDLDNTTLKPPHLLHCCNCTKQGHESSTCRAYRWSQHFPTPAAVTDYTTGLMYEPEADNSSKCSRDNIILPLEETSSEKLILPNITSMQQAPGKHSGLSTIVSPSPLSEETDHIPISQEGISQTENFKANEICENEETKQLKYLANEKTFIDIIFSCGIFLQRNCKNAQAICHNLSKLVKSHHGEATITSLRFRQVSPTFLISLVKKQIPFEVKIGFLTHQRKDVMLQIVTVERHQKLLYDLLLHWINLPIEEKDYGIDAITLPRHPIKIFNILSSRIPQLRKMKFKSYNDAIKDPQKIFETIKRETTKLQEKINDPNPLGKTKRCKRQQKIVWRWQMRLLMIANTEPGQNKYMKQFQAEMKDLELKRHEMNEKLNIDIYLKLTYLYNMLFVPHTPADLDKMLIRFNERAKKQKLRAMKQQQQKSEKEINKEGNYALCTDVNLPPITPSTSQDINYVEDPSLDIQQNVGNNIENEREIVNNVSLIKNTTSEDRFEIMKKNAIAAMQIPPPPPFITSFHTNSATNLPLDYFVPMSEQNPSVPYPMPQKSMWGTRRAKNSFENVNFGKSHPKGNLYKDALELIKVTHEYRLPHLTSAAEELQRKVNSRMLQAKHINALKKLIKLEEKYQKNIDSYYTSLKT